MPRASGILKSPLSKACPIGVSGRGMRLKALTASGSMAVRALEI